MESGSPADFRVVFEFGGFRADPLTRRLSTDSGTLSLTPKAFDTLLVLIANRGAVISKQDLMDAIWADTAVEENNLTQQIAALRRVFGERAADHRFIVTFPGKGYSFVAPVNELEIAPNEEFVLMEATRSSLTIDISKVGFAPWRDLFGGGAFLGYSLAVAYALFICVLSFWPAVSPLKTQTVAVLSFRAAAEDKTLGVGIRDTLRARLGSLDDVALRPAGTDLPSDDPLVAGRQLNADVVLTGSIQRDHERIRVAVEMVNVRDERIVWGRTFDYDGSQPFELQDAIARETVRAMTTSSL